MGNKAHGSGRLTDEDHRRIYEMAEQGKKANQIAKLIKRHQSTVSWFMYSQGLQAPAYNSNRPTTYIRKGRVVRLFTRDEDVFITALRIQGFNHERIAAITSKRFNTERSAHVIKCRLIMLAAREEE